METIRYDVKAPDLRGKTNEQQALAIEEYVRETTRQMGIILRQLQDRSKAQEQAAVDSEKKLETEIAEALAASEARMGDYPIEVGTDGIWRYRKWASGDAECWGTVSWTISANGLVSSGAVYSLGRTVALPEGLFNETPDDIQISAGNTSTANAYWVGHYGNSSESAVYYQIFRGAQLTAATTFNVNIHAIGKWKTGGDDNGQ